MWTWVIFTLCSHGVLGKRCDNVGMKVTLHETNCEIMTNIRKIKRFTACRNPWHTAKIAWCYFVMMQATMTCVVFIEYMPKHHGNSP